MRLDIFIFNKYNLKSRTYASQLIKKGKVLVNEHIVLKVSEEVNNDDNIVVNLEEKYASQGAYKLKKAIEDFNISVKNKICADFGCSNGGFTDILLKNGASYVYAYDVGECVLEQSLLKTNKVKFIKCNLRYLPDDAEKVDFVCCDVSFISVNLVIPSIAKILNTNAEGVLLIKPQFEAGKKYLSKGGIVKDKKIHEQVINKVIECLKINHLTEINKTTSPIYYEDKNVEYLLHFKKG